MSWDFETDPQYQKELDWVDTLVRDEVDPSEFLIDHTWDLKDPVRQKLTITTSNES